MATKQSNVNEKRKHLIPPNVERKEKSRKTSKTDSTIKEVITIINLSEKKNAVLYSASVVSLGMCKVIHC